MHCGAGCLVVVVDAVAVPDSDGIAGFVARQHNATCLEGNTITIITIAFLRWLRHVRGRR